MKYYIFNESGYNYLGLFNDEGEARKYAEKEGIYKKLDNDYFICTDEYLQLLREKCKEAKVAVNTIKSYCNMFKDCRMCILHKDGGCGVESNPYAWEVDDGEE